MVVGLCPWSERASTVASRSGSSRPGRIWVWAGLGRGLGCGGAAKRVFAFGGGEAGPRAVRTAVGVVGVFGFAGAFGADGAGCAQLECAAGVGCGWPVVGGGVEQFGGVGSAGGFGDPRTGQYEVWGAISAVADVVRAQRVAAVASHAAASSWLVWLVIGSGSEWGCWVVCQRWWRSVMLVG
ncbi:hypothetical protein EV191_1394 [Tamaricihabitans halophyticus]|uniref:Uncharacterized protein n=1 Tax=Tamaricihabitans halophyticus TaxID=1262583 RepID=A0A4R2PS67_9PSEU|nr:hypothetical protein EV191_1394 [Tamaricihabitans halophyticus]